MGLLSEDLTNCIQWRYNVVMNNLDNGLLPARCQTIRWTNADIFSFQPSRTSFMQSKSKYKISIHDDVNQMETISALLAIYTGNSPVTGELPAQRPVTRSFGVFYQRLNRRLSKQSWGWWFETPSRPLWRHCNDATFKLLSAKCELFCPDLPSVLTVQCVISSAIKWRIDTQMSLLLIWLIGPL